MRILAVVSRLVVFGILIVAALGNHAAAQPYADESPAQHDARMKWWRDARFGLFIHWGVYSVPAGFYHDQPVKGIGEWIMQKGKIPVAEYREFAREFNPTKYDPDAWAQLAADAGVKYIVITSKHHDGFAMFPSAASKWNIADASPYGKDIIGPLAEAARRHGLHFGLYYSHAQDWNNPGGAKSQQKDNPSWDPAQDGSFDDYLTQTSLPQVQEILERYHPDVIWWDTSFQMNADRANRFLPILAPYPNLIVNDRLHRQSRKGDFGTPEQHIPDTGIKGDWETCMTMNDTWGFKSDDQHWKSTETLLHNLIDIASKGGNYLLNVGPKSDGTIPEESIERLRAMGKWMKTNGEAIYGTTASPIPHPAWGRITTKLGDDTTALYLNVFDWPTDGNLPVALTNNVRDCHLLADPAHKLTVDKSADAGLMIHLTGDAPDPIASVIVLTIDGQPQALPQAASAQK
jgi:alpha-L-fucosidase